jgi:murein endopeptidase
MRARTLLVILLTLTAFGCGEKTKGPRQGRTDFSDSGAKSPPKSEDPVKPQETANPTPAQIQRQLELDQQMQKENKEATVSQYQTPAILRDRLREARPELVVEASQHFTIEEPFLDVSSKTQTFTFKALLKIKGKADERLEMKCAFTKEKGVARVPWSCNDMYPVDQKVASQRRLQATVNCADNYRWELDSYPCEDVGIEIFVVVNGKTESQLFQTRKFSARIATSGDEEEPAEQKSGLNQLESPVPAGPRIQQKSGGEETLQAIDPVSAERPKTKPSPVTEEAPVTAIDPVSAEPPKKPTPGPSPDNFDDQPIVFAPEPDQAEELSDAEIADAMDDANVALEFTAPIPQPRPDDGPQSIPGIQTLRPELGADVPDQAQGSHNNGRLQSASELPASGKGFKSRSHGTQDFGAEIMISLLKGAASNADAVDSGAPDIVVGGIAKRTGGCLTTVSGGCHASHRNGLDADVAFPGARAHGDLWPACEALKQTRQVRRMGKQQSRTGTFCKVGGSISRDLDEKRFWAFVKSVAGAKGEPVIAMFLDPEIKKHMCNYAKSTGENISDPASAGYKALRAMKDEPGHYNHVHIRVRCPGNRGCRGQDSIVTLGNGTGC